MSHGEQDVIQRRADLARVDDFIAESRARPARAAAPPGRRALWAAIHPAAPADTVRCARISRDRYLHVPSAEWP